MPKGAGPSPEAEAPRDKQAQERFARDATATAGLPLKDARRLGPFVRNAGFGTKLSRGFRFIQNAYALAFQKKSLLLPVLLGFLVTLLLVAAGVLVFLRYAPLLTSTKAEFELWMKAHAVELAIGFLLWSFAQRLANQLFLGVTVTMVDAHLKGLPVPLGGGSGAFGVRFGSPGAQATGRGIRVGI